MSGYEPSSGSPYPESGHESRPRVSVVMANWNARRVMLDALRSLEAHPPPGRWEAIVVDNGSTDGSVEHLRRELPWVTVIANPTNRGLPAANNQGMLAARGEALLICNPDVVFAPGAAAAMVDLLDRRPRAGGRADRPWPQPRPVRTPRPGCR